MDDLDAEMKRLEIEKLKREIAVLDKPPNRFTMSNALAFVVGIGMLAVAVAGFWLNNTVKTAAANQTKFENYSKLIDEFAKGGTAREGAIVGSQPFLQHGSPESGQAVAILVNDLRLENDPVAPKAIEQALESAGVDAYDDAKEANMWAYDQFIESADRYVGARLMDEFLRTTSRTNPAWQDHAKRRVESLAYALKDDRS